MVKYLPSIWTARRAWTKHFVTGATGFIGGRVVRQLIEAGHKVFAVVRNPSRAQDLRALGVDVRARPAKHDGNGPTDSPRSPRDDRDGILDLRGARLGSRFVRGI